MIQAVGAIGTYCDPEYLRILRELMQLGITPSYNKSIDKAKLEKAKLELVQKAEQKMRENQPYQIQGEAAGQSERSKAEEERIGAMTLAELNRMFFGL